MSLGLIRFEFFGSREDAKTRRTIVLPDIEELSAIVVDAGFKIHRDLGPGLLESAYEIVLFSVLEKQGLRVNRQVPIHINYDGIQIENAFRIDLLVEDRLIIEIKSTDQTHPVHAKQVITYLRLMNLSLGLVMNFGTATFKEGVRRLVNNHSILASSRLRANNLSGHQA